MSEGMIARACSIEADYAAAMAKHYADLEKNRSEVLAQVALAISSAEADITHLDMDAEATDETIELRLLVSVRDRVHLADVLRTMRRSPVA